MGSLSNPVYSLEIQLCRGPFSKFVVIASSPPRTHTHTHTHTRIHIHKQIHRRLRSTVMSAEADLRGTRIGVRRTAGSC